MCYAAFWAVCAFASLVEGSKVSHLHLQRIIFFPSHSQLFKKQTLKRRRAVVNFFWGLPPFFGRFAAILRVFRRLHSHTPHFAQYPVLVLTE